MRTFFTLSATFFIVSCCVLACFSGFAAETKENWATEAYKRNCPSIVFIQGDKVEERRSGATDAERTFNGMGSGIIIDERGYIITNYHVVKDIRKIQVKTHDEKDYIAELVAQDSDTDLALIKINARTPLRPITFGRSNDLMPGEDCLAIGNPYGYVFSLTEGRIGQINREVGVNDSSLVYRNSIQASAAINPGNSGGPLIDVNGEMIGINVAIRQGAAGIAFATPVDQVVDVAAKLMSERVNQQITYGLTVSQLEPKDYNAIKRFIIRVDAVESNSPAARAGIQKGDILTEIGKYTLRNKFDFYRALLDMKTNEEVAFSFFRNGELQDTVVAMGASRNSSFANNRTVSAQPAAVAPKTANDAGGNSGAARDKLVWENLGITYTPIPTQEFERTYKEFLAKFEGGVIVKAVRAGSSAEQAGLLPGDVLAGIGPWGMVLADNVRYVGAQEWSRLQTENKTLPADVIRDNTHYTTEIPMK